MGHPHGMIDCNHNRQDTAKTVKGYEMNLRVFDKLLIMLRYKLLVKPFFTHRRDIYMNKENIGLKLCLGVVMLNHWLSPLQVINNLYRWACNTPHIAPQ